MRVNTGSARITMLLAAAFLLTLTGIVSAVGSNAASRHLRSEKDRTEAPDFAFTDENGAPVTLSAYSGRVVLLDFWATWCTGCKVEIPWYVAFQKKYASRGLACLGVAMDDDGWQVVKPYLEVHPINYRIVLGNPDLIKPYQITNLPVTLLIDRKGKIADAHVGMVVKDVWEKEIQLLLKEKPSKQH